MRNVNGGRVAFDATVLVRAAVDTSGSALAWLAAVEAGEAEAVAPDLIWLEVGNALAGYVRTGRLSTGQARRALASLLRLPQRTASGADLVEAAFAFALARGLSVYDACYGALAEAEGAVLVTADRALADAVVAAELLA